ncbi:MAG: transporter substrate-binding domain-containing protein [Rhodospirillales bacterium]|tara:strand:- start:440 stop:1201 length:762 start_codon:yes stop_codon:yes gene_type:complete
MRRLTFLSALTVSLAAVLALSMSPVRAAEMTVAFAIAKPPFVHATQTGPAQAGDKGGIELDIMKAALAPRGHSFQALYSTYDQLTGLVLQGRAAAAATVRPENPALFYSNEFVSFHNVAVTRADAPAPAAIADLAGLSMVAWEGATKDLGPAFAEAAAKSSKYAEMGDQKAQVQAFLDGQFQALIIDGTIFRYWKKVLGGKAADFKFHALFGGHTPFVVGFADETIRNDFNSGLKEIRQNGVYDVLFNSHIAD